MKGEVSISNFEILVNFNTLIEYLTLTDNLTVDIAHQEMLLSPMEEMRLILSVPKDFVSVEDKLFISSTNPFMVCYKIAVDDKVVIPESRMMPTGDVEIVTFYNGRIKHEKVEITFKNIDKFQEVRVWYKVSILLIKKDFFTEIIKPLFSLLNHQINKRIHALEELFV